MELMEAETDSEDELPEGWEERTTVEGTWCRVLSYWDEILESWFWWRILFPSKRPGLLCQVGLSFLPVLVLGPLSKIQSSLHQVTKTSQLNGSIQLPTSAKFWLEVIRDHELWQRTWLAGSFDSNSWVQTASIFLPLIPVPIHRFHLILFHWYFLINHWLCGLSRSFRFTVWLGAKDFGRRNCRFYRVGIQALFSLAIFN